MNANDSATKHLAWSEIHLCVAGFSNLEPSSDRALPGQAASPADPGVPRLAQADPCTRQAWEQDPGSVQQKMQVLRHLARAPSGPLLWGGPLARMASSMALAEQARQLFESTVGAVLPGPLLQRALSLDPDSGELKVRDRSFQLRQNLYLVGFGKAVLGMAAAAEELLGQHLVQGVISVPKGIRAAMEHAGKQ